MISPPADTTDTPHAGNPFSKRARTRLPLLLNCAACEPRRMRGADSATLFVLLRRDAEPPPVPGGAHQQSAPTRENTRRNRTDERPAPRRRAAGSPRNRQADAPPDHRPTRRMGRRRPRPRLGATPRTRGRLRTGSPRTTPPGRYRPGMPVLRRHVGGRRSPGRTRRRRCPWTSGPGCVAVRSRRTGDELCCGARVIPNRLIPGTPPPVKGRREQQ